MSHAEQELPTLPENLTSSPVFNGLRVVRSLVFCVVFCRTLFAHLIILLFDHCFVHSSSFFGFWLSFWYLETVLMWEDNVKWSVHGCVVKRTSLCWPPCDYQRKQLLLLLMPSILLTLLWSTLHGLDYVLILLIFSGTFYQYNHLTGFWVPLKY